MKFKTTIAGVAILLLTQTAIAQFRQSNRLTDLSDQLSREAGDFADSSYSNFTNKTIAFRNDIDALMLAHQFAGASRIFYRMVVDGRSNQDLREAFDVLQNVARSIERNNARQSNWSNIQRLMSDIGGDLNVVGGGYDNNNNNNQYPNSGRSSGRMTWKGRVDDDIRIKVRGGSAQVETIGGTAYYNATQSFSASLPSRRVNVSLQVRKGRGEVFIEQQPSRENDYTAVVRIRDPKGGASDYDFELSW